MKNTHTIPIDEYLKLEIFLLEINDNFGGRDLGLSQSELNSVEVKKIVSVLGFEFYYIKEIISKYSKLIELFQNAIIDHYFLNIKNPNEVKFFKELWAYFDIVIPNSNNKLVTAYMFSVWMVVIFNNCFLNSESWFYDGLWINRYSIIQKFEELATSFVFKLNHKLKKINYKFSVLINPQETKILGWVVLHTIVNCGLILKRTIRVPKTNEAFVAKNTDEIPKTNVYLRLAEYHKFDSSLNNLNMYLQPIQIKKINNYYYVWSNHYFSIKPLLHKNRASKNSSQIGDLGFINLVKNIKFFIRWDFFTFLEKKLYQHYNYNEIGTLENFEKIFKNIKQRRWTKNSQREFSRLYSLNFFKKVKELKDSLENGFYFSYFFDFRGRLYADSPISYTNNIFFRHLYHYGIYSTEELTSILPTIHVSQGEIDLILKKSEIFKRYSKLDLKNKIVLYYIITIFFEIGKCFKNKILDKNEGRITKLQFIELGVDVFNANNVELEKLDKKLEYWSLTFLLESVENNVFLKIPIFKDATASGLQMLCLILGAKSIDTYKINNLLEVDVWYDTYYFIIKKFLENYTMPTHLKEKYFTRSILKKVIMTYNYNATYLRCWDYFKEEAGLPFFSKEEVNQEIEPHFHAFYNFLKKFFESDQYFNHPPKLLNHMYKKIWNNKQEVSFKTDDDFLIQLKYYNYVIDKRIDRIIFGKRKTRETFILKKLSLEPNSRKTFRALEPNLIHAVDAYVLRQLILGLGEGYATIHDCVGIEILRIEKFQKITKHTMQFVFNLNIMGVHKTPSNHIIIDGNMIYL